MRPAVLVLALLVAPCVVASCAGPPPVPTAASTAASAAAPAAPSAPSGLGALAPAFRDYRIGARRTGGAACTPSPASLRYIESLEYLGSPPVVFGLDASGCVMEIRAAAGTAQYEHALTLVASRLGAADGEDRATCAATGAAIESRYWECPEGRFEVVRGGPARPPEFVLRASGAPLAYPWLCEGEVRR